MTIPLLQAERIQVDSRALTPRGTLCRHNKTPLRCDRRKHGRSGDHQTERRRAFSYPPVLSTNSTSWYRTPQVSAALDIVLPSKAQCPWPLPYPSRYFSVYLFSWNPALRGHSKNFCGLSDFPPNNQKKCIRPSFYREQPH